MNYYVFILSWFFWKEAYINPGELVRRVDSEWPEPNGLLPLTTGSHLRKRTSDLLLVPLSHKF